VIWQVQTCYLHHGDVAGHQHRTLYSHAYETMQVCCQSSDKGEPYLQEGAPGSKCFQQHTEAVEEVGAAHLVPLAGLLGSIPLQGQ